MVAGAAPPSPPGANVLDQVVAGIDTGSSSSGPKWTAQPFSVVGLTGLFPGQSAQTPVTGADLVKAFLAAGQSTDPSVRSTVAAIEYALYAAGSGVYYNKGDKPNLGMVSNVDAAAFGKALSDLAQIGGANVGADAAGGIKPMTVAQFLTSQATLGSANGPNAPAAATKTVHVPNPENVAAEYRRVAQSLEGGRPNEAETQRFVRQYMAQYEPTAGSQQQYQRQAQGATATNPVLPGQPPPQLPPGLSYTNYAANTGINPAPGAVPADISQSVGTLTQDDPAAMATLADVLGTNASTGGTKIVPDAENLDVAAENFARNANPKAIAGNDMGNALGDFLNLISTKLV